MVRLDGVAYTILSSVAFGIMPVWVKLAYTTGLTAYHVLFLRALIACAFLYVFMRYKRIPYKLEQEQFRLVIFIGSIGYTGALLSLYIAYNYIGVGVSTALHYLYPVIVMLFSLFLFRQRLRAGKWSTLVMSLVGVYLMTAVEEIKLERFGVFIASLSAVLFAIYVAGVAHPKMKAVNSYALTFNVLSVSSLISFALIVITGQWPPPVTPEGLFYVTLIAFFCTSLAVLLFIKGIKIIGPSSASILSTLEPIVSLVAGVMLFHEALSWQVAAGSALVIAAVIMLTYIEAKEAPAENCSGCS
ncbi:DMT family transporter [Zhaonella formicivorans]|uniref:DMT family transporter n=1 Tax=Zhaonella formicivorans TaxID=2528593 RepID=UPI0010EFBC50|nr:DMT family transporter [Zhaonella formicivorans]